MAIKKKYPFEYDGVHTCEAAVLACIDFRFWRPAVQFIEEELGIKDFDFPSLPGSAKAIIAWNKGDISTQCIDVPFEKHEIKKVVVINHADCGAYGGVSEFKGDIEVEEEFHKNELRKAKEKVLAKYPDVEVILVFGKLVDDGTNVEFSVID